MECHQKHAACEHVTLHIIIHLRGCESTRRVLFLPLDSPKGKNGSVQSHPLPTHCCAAGAVKGGAITRREQAVSVAWSILPVKSANPEDIRGEEKGEEKGEKKEERKEVQSWVCTEAVRFASHGFKQPMETRWNWRVGVQQDTYVRNWSLGHFPSFHSFLLLGCCFKIR